MAKSVTKVIKVASGISKSGNVISLASGVAGTGLTYTTGTLSIGTGAITSTMILDGTITATDIAAANKDGTAATPSLRTLGTGSTQAAAGNDSRLSDSRTPTGTAGGDLSGTYPNPTIGTGKVTSTHILDGTIVNADINATAAIALSKLATDPLARANHTGTQTASTISNFDTQVRTSRLDQMAVPTASVSLNSQKITNVLDPTAAQDAATKNYVDEVAAGLDVKSSVKAATTANITLSGTQTIDGIALSAGDRVLVKNQTTTSANGIYVVAAGSWTRATDADAWTELPGAFCFVEQGTTLADTGWVCTVDSGGTLGTTAVAFSQFSGPGTYSAGSGLTLTGTTFSVGTGQITSAMISDGTITDTDIAAANKDGTAATASLRTLGTGATQAAAGNDSRLSDSRTPTGSAGGDLAGTYPNPTIGTGKVTSTHILDGTIVNADINASAAIALSKLATDPLARANHTGTQTASTISNFDTQVRTSRLDQMAAPTASVSLNSQKITNVLDPTAAQDAATKNYVDGVVNGLDVKASVKVATTANITLSGTQTIDGVAVVAGDRVLVKNQTTTSGNGIYVVASGSWTRATDTDAWSELPGAFCFVEQGTTLADTGWVCTVDSGGTLGTTAIAFSQFSGPGTYAAGTGITLTGTTFSIATGAITSTLIADGTITDTDVAAANKDGAAGTASMRTLGTGATQAAAGNDSRLSDSRTPTGSAGGDLAGTYPNPTIGTGKVTSTHILDGTIVNADINASAAIALSKLATDPLARANHTGTQTASTISNFDTQVRTSRLDQMAAPTASVSVNSQKITSLGTPTASTDAATKAYVDAACPTGIISDYSGSAAPSGWLLCNGATVSRTTYAALFAVTSTTYGAGDGSTTFALPDSTGKIIKT